MYRKIKKLLIGQVVPQIERKKKGESLGLSAPGYEKTFPFSFGKKKVE